MKFSECEAIDKFIIPGYISKQNILQMTKFHLAVISLLAFVVCGTYAECDPALCVSPQGFCGGDICYCHPGYYSPNCAQYSDKCEVCPPDQVCNRNGRRCVSCRPGCEEHGTCYNTADGTLCKCDEGWMGSACDVGCNVTKCMSPGGVCGGPGDDTCFCSIGYYGADCATFSRKCKASKCDEGQVCSVDGQACVSCDPDCASHGTCSNTPDGPICQCDEGWKGEQCEIACDPELCKSPGGFCGGPNNEQCYCNPGYYSPNCLQHSDICEACKDGQICNRNGRYCVDCKPECSEHGTCTATEDGAECLCDEGWGNPLCDMALPTTQPPVTEGTTSGAPSGFSPHRTKILFFIVSGIINMYLHRRTL